jgi:hypothetical protein
MRRPGFDLEPTARHPNEKTGTRASGVPAGAARPLNCHDPGTRRTGNLESARLLRAGGLKVKGGGFFGPEADTELDLCARSSEHIGGDPRLSRPLQGRFSKPLADGLFRQDLAVRQPPIVLSDTFHPDQPLAFRQNDRRFDGGATSAQK